MAHVSSSNNCKTLSVRKLHNGWVFLHVLQSLWMKGWASNCACNLVVWAAKIKAKETVQIVHLNTKETKKAKPTQPNIASFSLNSLIFWSRSLCSKWLVSKAAEVAHSQDFEIATRKPNLQYIEDLDFLLPMKIINWHNSNSHVKKIWAVMIYRRAIRK